MTIPIAAKIVILGETFNPTTPIAMPKTMTINTSVASKKLGVPFFHDNLSFFSCSYVLKKLRYRITPPQFIRDSSFIKIKRPAFN